MNRLSTYFWKLVSLVYYSRRFGSFGKGTWMRKPIALIGSRQINIGDNGFIRDGARLEVVNRPGMEPGRIVIGNNVNMEQNVHIVACDSIVIEDDVCFAPRCTIVDTTHPVGDSGSGNRAAQIDTARSFIHIGKRVFLGTNVVVLPNVTIGENSIVGANSVVTRDIPANCIAAGAPAKVIRHLDVSPSDESRQSA